MRASGKLSARGVPAYCIASQDTISSRRCDVFLGGYRPCLTSRRFWHLLATDDQAKPRRETVQERQASRWIEAEQPLHDLSVLPETMDQVARYTEADEPLPDLPALPENVDMDNLASGQPADDCFAQVVQDSFVHPDDMDSLPPAQTEEESSARPDKDSARSNRPAVLRTLQKLATLQSQHFPSSTLFDVLFTRSGKAAVELSSALKAMLEAPPTSGQLQALHAREPARSRADLCSPL